MAQVVDESLFLNEQRRFRRLEASLPVWVGREDDLRAQASGEADGVSPWSLGYTRDLSMGGSKIIVPPGEERKWAEAAREGALCLLRFDTSERGEDEEYITGRVRHAAHDKQAGNFWLGVQYEDGAHTAKASAMRAGLSTMRRRQRWQGAFALAVVALLAGGWFIRDQQTQLKTSKAREARLDKQRRTLSDRLLQISSVGLVGSRAEGAALAFQERDVRQRLQSLSTNMKRFSSAENEAAGEAARKQRLLDDGLQLSSAPATGSNVEMGVALPYGYAWPIVVSDLEDALGRRVPTVVIFRDFKAPFPLGDARETRVRAKTLQITWEPWHFSNPGAVKLRDIPRGKYDKYIDGWAQASKSFGAELWIRFAHEFNGNWYPWSVSANGRDPKAYIAAFRHVRNRFNRAGAFNVRWIWCVNAESVPDASWNDARRAYPGDAYVDMISIDGYNFGTALPGSRWQSFSQVFARPYAELSRRFPNKPLMIGEVGSASVGGDKVAWIKDMDRQLRGRFKRIQGVVWFEAAKEADWRMVSSPEVLAASRAMWLRQHYRRGES
jgi:hypothetical protein